MTGHQRKTLDGRMVTRKGMLDLRHNNRGKQIENGGKPYMFYEVSHYPNQKLPWKIYQYDAADGKKELVGSHTTEARALKHCEQLRIKQPDRRASAKLRHKLGVD